MADICNDGNGIDQIMLKIELPKLPNDIKYKQFCIYDLLDKITFEIGGSIIFKYNSDQLKKIDMAESNIYALEKLCSVSKNNCIYYPISLYDLFGSSEIQSESIGDVLDLEFKGLRLYNLIHDSVSLSLTYC